MSTPGARFKGWIESLANAWKDKVKDWLTDTRLAKIDAEIAITSLDPSKFKTKEVRELAEQLKKALAHSPGGVADWAQTIMGDFMVKIWDVALGIMLPSKMETFEDAKFAASWLSFLVADFIVLSAVLEIVATSTSLTMIRNLIHVFQLFASTFGMDRYISATIAPALATSIIPKLTRGYNAQYLPFFPSPEDLVLWEAKEVFEPDMQAKFGLTAEFEKLDLSMFAEAGVSEEQARNFWIAHWTYPSVGQVFDMYHRGVIPWEDVFQYMRLAELPPYWREKLKDISWDLPNRIELRMMARYGLVDKAFLLKILAKIGLHEDYRSITADMMLVMGIQSDLSTRYGKGWITSNDVKSELARAGLDSKIQERVFQWIVKQSATERTSTEKNLTKAEIVKGVKKSTITRAEGQTLIQEMGYDEKEAKFILDINVPTEETAAETKQRELTKSDILNAYKLGQIDEAETVAGLMSIRYSEDDAIFLLTLTIVTIEKIAEVKQRNLTKADIIKGVKNGVITQEEGYLMLLNIGYTDDESIFILTVSATAPTGSPDTYNEFLVLTQSYKASLGLSTQEVTPDIMQAEKDVKIAQAALKVAKDMKAKAKRIQELELVVEQVKQRYHQLVTSPKTST